MTVKYEFITKYDSVSKAKNYVLDILMHKSIFRSEMRKKSDSMVTKTGLGQRYYMNPNYEIYLSKDLQNSIFKKKFVHPMSRDQFFIKINEELKWKVLSDTCIIAKFNCQKAEVDYGGRHWIAWFTTDIPLPEGPYYFHGLPGLIIQLADSEENFVFAATEIKNINNNPLYEIPDGKEITWEQYGKLLQEFFQNPYSSVQVRGMKVVSDNENGGYKEIDYRTRIKENQKMLLKNNNPIELNHKVEYH